MLIKDFFSYFSLLGFVGQQSIEKIWKCEPTGGTLKWGTIIPLIGGSSIGCSKSAGNLPAFHLTYTPFKNNETHLERYWPKVPKYYIDKDQQPENMTGKSLNMILPWEISRVFLLDKIAVKSQVLMRVTN